MIKFLDPTFLITTVGLAGVVAIIFAESGLFFGFFLPGDSLLFTAGLLASQGYFSIIWLMIGAAAAAILGDSVGYWFGQKTGPAIFTREDSFFIKNTSSVRRSSTKSTARRRSFSPASFRSFAPSRRSLPGWGRWTTRHSFHTTSSVASSGRSDLPHSATSLGLPYPPSTAICSRSS